MCGTMVVHKNATLALIRVAGGVYDFRNFEQVQLHNTLRKDILTLMYY
jgi:hypothetical protein